MQCPRAILYTLLTAGAVALTMGCDSSTAPDDGGQPGPPVWATSAGGTGNDIGNQVAVAADGAIFMVGSFSGTAIFGADTLTSAGSTDGFLAKYDEAGTSQWARSMGGPNADVTYAVAVSPSGRVWVAGDFTGTGTFGLGTITARAPGDRDVFLTSFTSDGSAFGSYWIGGPELVGDVATSLSINVSGYPTLVGSFNSTLNMGFTPRATAIGGVDAFLMNFVSESGNQAWVRTVGSAGGDQARAVSTDASGNLVVAGFYSDTATISDTTLTSPGITDIYLAKYDPSGDLLWAWQATSNSASALPDAIAVVGDDIYVTATFDGTLTFASNTLTSNGDLDAALIAFAPDGGVRWATSFGGFSADIAPGLAPAPDGGVFVGGQFRSTMTIGSTTISGTTGRGFLARFTSGGFARWAQAVSAPNNNRIASIAAVGGGAVMTGAFVDGATFGSRTVTARGAWDVLLVRTGESGWK